MPYLVRKGTRIIIQKPSGEVTQHACRDDTVFHAFEKVSELKTLQFKRDGFVVSVAAADVIEAYFKCPQCDGKSEIEGLCEGCRERWLLVYDKHLGKQARPMAQSKGYQGLLSYRIREPI